MMVSGAYCVDEAANKPPRVKPRAPPRPIETPPPIPPPPSQLHIISGTPIFISGKPPSPPPRISSMKFSYIDNNNFDFTHPDDTITGPGRLPIYRAESPSSSKTYCCEDRRFGGVSLVYTLIIAAAAILALFLLFGAIAYFLLIAETNPEQNEIRQTIIVSSTVSTTPSSNSGERAVSYATPPPRPKSVNNTVKDQLRNVEESLFKDVIVAYQPYKPTKNNNTADGFVPHWFREELVNTGEERSSTPNRFTTTSPIHVSPTLPSAYSTPSNQQSNVSDGGVICHSPRLEACRGVLPYDLTTTQQTTNIGARLEAAAGALGFAHVARGACRLSARQLLCSILEPPCQPDNRVLLPCRSACQAAVSECGEFLLETLGLGKEFDCSNYPESSDPSMCVDLTGDCIDSSNRCASSGACIPSHWRCDTRDDCSDNSDEKNCLEYHTPTLRPAGLTVGEKSCKTGQAKCLDGSCIESSQLCDGIQHCLRGEDETICPPS